MGIHDGHREKMRHRFCETGLEGFADHEALELLLYYAIPRRDTNELAHRLLARKRLSEGGSAAAELNIRRLVENALLSSASAVILSHNHPSGIALPSREDYATTQQAQDALRTIGVELLDHIIVAEDDYVSLADSGILRR